MSLAARHMAGKGSLRQTRAPEPGRYGNGTDPAIRQALNGTPVFDARTDRILPQAHGIPGAARTG